LINKTWEEVGTILLSHPYKEHFIVNIIEGPNRTPVIDLSAQSDMDETIFKDLGLEPSNPKHFLIKGDAGYVVKCKAGLEEVTGTTLFSKEDMTLVLLHNSNVNIVNATPKNLTVDGDSIITTKLMWFSDDDIERVEFS
jgi:hypothetical protein